MIHKLILFFFKVMIILCVLVMLCGWIGDYAIVWTRSVGTAAITARLRDNVVGITVSRFYKPDYALIYKTDQLYSTVY
ncbi:MAG: hypothetical protein ACYTF1_20515, partial [Planctomycetota bacterium]